MVMAMRMLDKTLMEHFEEFQKEKRDGKIEEETMWPQEYFERDMTFVGLTAMENTL